MTAAEFADARSRLLMLARALMDDRETLRAAVVRLSVTLTLDPAARDVRHEYIVCLELLTAATQLQAAELAFGQPLLTPTDLSAGSSQPTEGNPYMNEGATLTVGEPLRPVDPAKTVVSYQLTITKTITYEAHEQNYSVVARVPVEGSERSRDLLGYLTTHTRKQKTETVFDAKVSRMPSLTALAKLVEPDGAP